MNKAHVELALRFVRMAEGRPIDNARRRQFAEARTQAALKVSPLEANAIVDAAYRLHRDEEAVAGAEVAVAAAETDDGTAAKLAELREENAQLGEELGKVLEHSLARGEEIASLRAELEALKTAPAPEAEAPTTPVVDNNAAQA